MVERIGGSMVLRAGRALALTPLQARAIGIALVLLAHEAVEDGA